MEEKVIIKSKHYNMKKIKGIIIGIPSALLGLGILLYLCNFDRSRGPNYWGEYWTILDNMFDPFSFLPGLLIDLGLIICIISVVIGLWLKSYSMTVTDKRIYGSTSWGKHVDLPVDSVSAIATNAFKGIAVATSSGKIVFNFIKNREEVHTAINKLIIDRQERKNTKSTVAVNVSNADELKKYKDLLDNGIITQEEFEAKKKMILGILFKVEKMERHGMVPCHKNGCGLAAALESLQKIEVLINKRLAPSEKKRLDYGFTLMVKP